MSLIDDINSVYSRVHKTAMAQQGWITKSITYSKRIEIMRKLSDATRYDRLNVSEEEAAQLIKKAEELGWPKCDGGKDSCNRDGVRKFSFVDRGTWHVCKDHYKEVLDFIKIKEYKGVFDQDIMDPGLPGLTINYCIPALSFSILFRNSLRGLDSLDGEETEFDLVLKDTGPNKILVIKEIRAITGAALKEAKDMADNPPKIIKKRMSKWDADMCRKLLEDAGATVEFRR